jgi:thiosulfate/3-mercaptopyruvate sulfurtransferase
VSVLVTVDDLVRAGKGTRPPRWRLGGPPGLETYRAGHIPGAVYVDLDGELAGPAAPGLGRHPLPEIDALQAAARSWGVRQGDPVVVYDDVGGLSAARAWWLLRQAGVAEVSLLDGGYQAWVAANLPVATGDQLPPVGDVVLARDRPDVLEADDVLGFVASGGLLLDARAAGRYRGEVASVDPLPGHIPGAVSAPTTENLTADGRFLDRAALQARFEALGAESDRPLAVYCGSGVTAAHQVAALELAGFTTTLLYPGSWSAWATTPGRPVEGPGVDVVPDSTATATHQSEVP